MRRNIGKVRVFTFNFFQSRELWSENTNDGFPLCDVYYFSFFDRSFFSLSVLLHNEERSRKRNIGRAEGKKFKILLFHGYNFRKEKRRLIRQITILFPRFHLRTKLIQFLGPSVVSFINYKLSFISRKINVILLKSKEKSKL